MIERRTWGRGLASFSTLQPASTRALPSFVNQGGPFVVRVPSNYGRGQEGKQIQSEQGGSKAVRRRQAESVAGVSASEEAISNEMFCSQSESWVRERPLVASWYGQPYLRGGVFAVFGC